MRSELDTLPPSHDRLNRLPRSNSPVIPSGSDSRPAINTEAGSHLPTVPGAKSDHSTVVFDRLSRHRSWERTRAPVLRLLEKHVVENPAVADNRFRHVAGRLPALAPTRGHDADAANPVRVLGHLAPDAEILEDFDAARGHRAAAGLVPWEVVTIDEGRPGRRQALRGAPRQRFRPAPRR